MTKSPRLYRVLAAITVSALALSACGSSSPVASANEAFVVNGTSYSLDTFETLIADLVANEQLEVSANNLPSKEDTISVLRTLIRYEAYKQYLKDNNLKEDQTDRSKMEAEAAADESFSALPDYLQELLINLSLAQVTMGKFKAFTAAELKTLYNEAPASTGVLCLSHILLETEEDAKAVLKELSNGAKFTDVAKKKSIEPAAKESGGSLQSDEERCTDLTFFQQQFDSDFMVGAVAAKAGVPTGPVKTQFGYHIILSQPYDLIKDSLARVSAVKPSVSNLAGYMATVDISVNSTYGVWNGAMATIS